MTGNFVPPLLAVDACRLATLDEYEVLDSPPEPGFDGIVLLARTLCAAPSALISFMTRDRQWFKARSGFGPEETPLSQSVCVHTLGHTGILTIPDLRDDPLTRNMASAIGGAGVRFYAGIPLRADDGQPIGTLCVLDTVPRPQGLLPEQAEGLQVLAKLVMELLELRRELRLHHAANSI